MKYIGSFNMQSGSLLIGDPMATMITAKHYHLDNSNLRRMHFIDTMKGIWNVYHIPGIFGQNDALLLINEEKEALLPETRDVEHISNNLIRYGKIFTSFGRSVFAVDADYFNNPSFSYSSFHEDALYNIDDLLTEIKNPDQNICFDEQLKAICNYAASTRYENIQGRYIVDLANKINMDHISSNIWSIDAVERASSSLTNTSIIKGGVVSCTKSEFCSCYADSDHPFVFMIWLNHPDVYSPVNNSAESDKSGRLSKKLNADKTPFHTHAKIIPFSARE